MTSSGALPSRAFKDFDLSFRRNPITKDVNTLKNENAIKEAVKNIVRYNFYEKPFLPNYGGNITGALFELYESGQSSLIEEQIKQCKKLCETNIAEIRWVDLKDYYSEYHELPFQINRDALLRQIEIIGHPSFLQKESFSFKD